MDLINKIDETITFNDNNIRIVGTVDSPWFVASDVILIVMLLVVYIWFSGEFNLIYGGVMSVSPTL